MREGGSCRLRGRRRGRMGGEGGWEERQDGGRGRIGEGRERDDEE